MYLLSAKLGNLKVQLINVLKFICQKRELKGLVLARNLNIYGSSTSHVIKQSNH
jgi:hypothetical protein